MYIVVEGFNDTKKQEVIEFVKMVCRAVTVVRHPAYGEASSVYTGVEPRSEIDDILSFMDHLKEIYEGTGRALAALREDRVKYIIMPVTVRSAFIRTDIPAADDMSFAVNSVLRQCYGTNPDLTIRVFKMPHTPEDEELNRKLEAIVYVDDKVIDLVETDDVKTNFQLLVELMKNLKVTDHELPAVIERLPGWSVEEFVKELYVRYQ